MAITALGTVLVFLGGLSSSFIVGRSIEHPFLARLIRAMVPDFQMFWVADALNVGASIPVSYVLSSALYSLSCIVAALSVGCWLFSRTEVS